MMNNKKGFTLTEILLAVMIVGLVGVALAALTTAASRESGVGRSKVLMRNNLSLALRTLRNDINNATFIDEAKGPISGSYSGLGTVTLLKLRKNATTDGETVQPSKFKSQTDKTTQTMNQEYVTYCFIAGTTTSNVDGAAVLPTGSSIGGRIYRASSSSPNPSCGSSSRLLLDNVKYIPGGNAYPVPLFCAGLACAFNSGSESASLLSVRIITELNSSPVTNDVIEEIFAVPNGF